MLRQSALFDSNIIPSITIITI